MAALTLFFGRREQAPFVTDINEVVRATREDRLGHSLCAANPANRYWRVCVCVCARARARACDKAISNEKCVCVCARVRACVIACVCVCAWL